jgi:thymidylate synthase ThyX
MIETRAICDSINPQDSRLMTMFWRYPKFLHQESLRHRRLYIHDRLYDPDFSFSVSSARAIPFLKLIEEVESDALRAAPLFWGAEQKGMSPGDELDEEAKKVAQLWWKRAALDAAKNARAMARAQGLDDAFPWQIPHKSIVNRIIEPYIHVNCLTTGTEKGWLNFFGLRLDKDADPTLKILAQHAWQIWNESKPKLLKPDNWHLPYIDKETNDELHKLEYISHLFSDTDPFRYDPYTGLAIKISAARCARLSYLSFDTGKRSTIEEDLKLYDRLVGGEILHASPLEHQATPDVLRWQHPDLKDSQEWENPEQSGNLGFGWRQFRKMLPNEEVAPLPKEFSL